MGIGSASFFKTCLACLMLFSSVAAHFEPDRYRELLVAPSFRTRFG